MLLCYKPFIIKNQNPLTLQVIVGHMVLAIRQGSFCC